MTFDAIQTRRRDLKHHLPTDFDQQSLSTTLPPHQLVFDPHDINSLSLELCVCEAVYISNMPRDIRSFFGGTTSTPIREKEVQKEEVTKKKKSSKYHLASNYFSPDVI